MSAVLPSKPAEAALAAVDRFGAVGSVLCAVHCAALPFVLVLAPALNLGFFASESFERGFTVLATAVVLASLSIGFRHHRSRRAFAFALPGLALIWLAAFGPLHAHLWLHPLAMATGGGLIAMAHFANLRANQAHVHGPRCRH